MNDEEKLRAQERISGRWGETYLGSARKSLELARQFSKSRDSFTAYLYLFVAFNNLYCLLGRFDGRECYKIRVAISRISPDVIESIYAASYLDINTLNDRSPEQFTEGQVKGVVNMKYFFLGKDSGKCVEHVGKPASLTASAEDKLKTLQDVAAQLLFTVRNNQFHAVKSPTRPADRSTLEIAYQVLLPLVNALMQITEGI